MTLTLNIRDETSPLTDLCVCRGTAIPDCEGFLNDHPEFETFPVGRWDRANFNAQQEALYEVFDRYGVRLHFIEHHPDLPWQAYTRDTGFVIGDKLYYAARRELPEREGEIDQLRRSLPALRDDDFVEIEQGRIEGGDVLPDGDVVFVGLGTRTTPDAVSELAKHVEVVPLHLGPQVMHLDTRMTILPGRRLLTWPGNFKPDDLAMLQDRFTLIEATEAEAKDLGTNVFVIDPETVVVHSGHERIAQSVEAAGLRVERVGYSEPIALLGSFRCTTMPLARAG